MNPLELPGPQFLRLYATSLIVALILSLVVRWLLRRPSGEPILDAELDGGGKSRGADGSAGLPPRRKPTVDAELDGGGKGLDAYQAAYLAGGPMRVVYAGLAALSQRGQLEVDSNKRRFTLVAGRPPRANALESRLGLAIGLSGTGGHDLHRRAGAITKGVRTGLVDRGLILSHPRARAICLVSALPVLALLGLGLLKALIGLSRGRSRASAHFYDGLARSAALRPAR